MAAIARPKLRENGGRPMSKKLTATVASVGSGKVPAAPVKVKLKRVTVSPAENDAGSNCPLPIGENLTNLLLSAGNGTVPGSRMSARGQSNRNSARLVRREWSASTFFAGCHAVRKMDFGVSLR